jgi:hypothetical protein
MGATDAAGDNSGPRSTFPLAGNITGIACANDTALTGAMTRTIDFMVNGSPATDVACVLNSSNQECTDTGTTSISAGDLVSVRNVPTNSASTSQLSCGIRFIPTTSGRWPFFSRTYNNSTAADNYISIGQPMSASSTGSEGWTQHLAAADMVAKAMYATTQNAPGSGANWAITLRESAADSSLTCTISDTNTSCNATTDVTINSGNLWNWEVDPSSGTTPASPGNTSISVEMAP